MFESTAWGAELPDAIWYTGHNADSRQAVEPIKSRSERPLQNMPKSEFPIRTNRVCVQNIKLNLKRKYIWSLRWCLSLYSTKHITFISFWIEKNLIKLIIYQGFFSSKWTFQHGILLAIDLIVIYVIQIM